jgi:hypothetical protein
MYLWFVLLSRETWMNQFLFETWSQNTAAKLILVYDDGDDGGGGSCVRGVTERCGQTLGTSSTYQNKKKCPYQHVSGNI